MLELEKRKLKAEEERRLKEEESIKKAESPYGNTKQIGEEIIEDLKRRDDIDSGRIHSPLTRADDAITVDTTNLTFDEQVAFIVNRVRNS